MLASEPGAVLGELTVDGLPQIIRVANDYLGARSSTRSSIPQPGR